MNVVLSEIFLSTVLGKTVINRQGHEFGRLQDLVMVPGESFPEVSHLLVRRKRETLCIPWQRVTLFNRVVISVDGSLQGTPQYQKRAGDILLRRDILDRQIVDLNGAKVVRVNDLKLGSFGDKLCVFFVDVGFRGILRRLGYEELGARVAALCGRQLPHYHISWQYVQLLETNLYRLTLTVAREQLKELHPADLARILSSIPSGHVQGVLDTLDTQTAAEAIHELEPELRSRVFCQLESGQACSILEEMAPDQAADLLGGLSEEKTQELLGLLDEKEADEIQELLAHEEYTAGGLMNSRFITLPGELSAGEALQLVRGRAGAVDTIYYQYVLDGEEQLRGVVSIRELLVSEPQARVRDIMTTAVKSVHVDSTPGEVLEIVTRYNFIALPVLDREEKMAGIITVDDLLELFIPSALRRRRYG